MFAKKFFALLFPYLKRNSVPYFDSIKSNKALSDYWMKKLEKISANFLFFVFCSYFMCYIFQMVR